MPKLTTNRTFAVAALAFAAALAPVVVGAWLLHESAAQHDDERLVRLHTDMEERLRQENKRYIDYLLGIGNECAAGLTDEQWKWRRSTDDWTSRFPHLDAIGWAQNTADLTQAETRFHATRESTPVAAPLKVGANGPWVQALQEARASKAEPLSPVTEIAPSTAGKLTVFLPIRSRAPGGGVAGFALGELQWRPLVEESVAGAAEGQLTWKVLQLCPVGTLAHVPSEQRLSFAPFPQEAQIHFTPTTDFWRDSQRRQSWLILLCGVPLACLVAWVAARQSQRRAVLESRVAERTAELRAAHDRLAEALTHERELNAMKTNFISMVTHELRTPLSVVQSSSDILSRYLGRLPEEKRAEHFRAISHAVMRITDLSDEVLLFSRFESQRVQLKLAPLQLVPFCGALVHEMLSATSEKCPIAFESAPELPIAHADERLLRHVLVNLLSNAVKYSPNNSPVKLRLVRESERAIFTVEDHGMGIAANEQARLFHSFHRGSNVEHLPGTGLGLVIVKRCVELHGGTIALRSEEGRGTTVTVDLPIFTQPKPESTTP
jgi:signal transduction histidine kinase